MDAERFTFFWEGGSPFSQWYKGSPFELDGVEYVCAEQGMMHRKALLFGDYKAASEILSTTNPRKMKALGRKASTFAQMTVTGFVEEVWLQHREDIVYRVNAAKFAADPVARAALLETAGTTIVEASPVDAIWGIGLSKDDPDALDPARWRGLNLLGKAIERVRDEMLAAGPGGGHGD